VTQTQEANVRDPEVEPRRQQLLVEDMIMILRNIRHLAAYRAIAATVPEDLIRQALREIQQDEASEIGNPVAYFLQEMHRVTAHRSPHRTTDGNTE
jgi:hypothetical protein